MWQNVQGVERQEKSMRVRSGNFADMNTSSFHLNGHYFCLGFDHILIHLAILLRQAALKQTSETKPQKPLLKTDGQREFNAGWDCQGDTKLSDRAVGFVSLRKKNTISIFFFIDLQIKVDCVKVPRTLAQRNPSLDLFWFIPARGKILFSSRIIHISLVLKCAGQMLQEEEGVKWVCDLKDALQLLLLTAPLPSPSEKLEQKYYLFRQKQRAGETLSLQSIKSQFSHIFVNKTCAWCSNKPPHMDWKGILKCRPFWGLLSN